MSEDYIDRLINEKSDLANRASKLLDFITEDIEFENLHYTEQRRLTNQLFVMEQYESILTERIEHAHGRGIDA